MNSRIDEYLQKSDAWQSAIKALRNILLDCKLDEDLKWGKPCYSFRGNNIAIIQPFKDSCALMFFKGSLLKDPEGVLEKPGKNSRIARRISFKGVEEIQKLKPILKSYIFEAVEIEKAGLKVEIPKKAEPLAEELQRRLKEYPQFKAAFENLTPGRQRAYNLYFSAAKQAKTRESRIKKYVPKILSGKGLNDR